MLFIENIAIKDIRSHFCDYIYNILVINSTINYIKIHTKPENVYQTCIKLTLIFYNKLYKNTYKT